MADYSSHRMKNLLNDIEAIKKACAEDKHCPFRGFEYDNFVFKFEYHDKNEKRFFWINLSEDYPNSSSLTCTVNGSVEHYTKRFDLPLPFEFCSLARELYKEMSIPVVSLPSTAPSTSKRPADCEYDDPYGDSVSEEECDNEDYDMDTYEENFEANSESRRKIDLDFAMLKQFCEDAQMTEIQGLDLAEFLFPISTNSLEDELARAWKLDPTQPIFIQATFSLRHYTYDLSMVRIEVFQRSQKAADSSLKSDKLVSPILLQLQSTLVNFIKTLDKEAISAIENQMAGRKLRQKPEAKHRRLSDDTPDSKKPPNFGSGFLVELMAYAQQRLNTLNRYCVICDELHIFVANMLKPMVCSRPLCIFSYQTLGVMSSVADAISTDFEVVDLLIKMAKAACSSSRSQAIFDPFPTIIDPKDSTKLALSPEKKDFNLVKSVMDKFLPMEEMVFFGPTELKINLDQKDVLIYPLLQWIISSNRCHIVKLSQDKQLACIKTPHQFLLRSSAPEKEEVFKKAKKKLGSIYAFHGSPIENWHSIMRKGLVNASGTKLQLNGAACGSGIYLSPESSVSFTYMGSPITFGLRVVGANLLQGPSSKSQSLQFLPSQNIYCMALCEVINSTHLRKNHSIWVMPEEDFVVTRFLFVFENIAAMRPHICSTNPEVLRQINKALNS